MDAISVSLFIFICLAVPAAVLWFLKERRDKWCEKRNECRRRMHVLRSEPSIDTIKLIRETCGESDIPLEEIGTRWDELDQLERAAHQRMALALLGDMRRGSHDHKSCLLNIVDHLRQAGRPYDWESIGTKWIELRDLHHQGLILRARARFQSLRDQKWANRECIDDGEVQLLLALANATKDDLYPAEVTDTEKAS